VHAQLLNALRLQAVLVVTWITVRVEQHRDFVLGVILHRQRQPLFRLGIARLADRRQFRVWAEHLCRGDSHRSVAVAISMATASICAGVARPCHLGVNSVFVE